MKLTIPSQLLLRALVAISLFTFVACEDAATTPGAGESDGTIEGGVGSDAAVGGEGSGEGNEPEAGPGADASAEPSPEPSAPACEVGETCDDGDLCTVGDVFDEDCACAGEAKNCSDGLDCTEDTCSGGACESALMEGFCLFELSFKECVATGSSPTEAPCRFCETPEGEEPFLGIEDDGVECSDADQCTLDGACELGNCVPAGTVDCVAGNPCVEATCDPALGCMETPLEGPCEDGDACTADDVCAEGSCAAGADTDCDDADPCTVDTCHLTAGCLHAAVDCDDELSCTQDACDESGDCTNLPFDGPCEDGDLCTVGEACAEGACTGGGPADCDDDEVCTDDGCDPAVGCEHFNLEGPCDDGIYCSKEDACTAGICLGIKQSCANCPLPITKQAAKVTSLGVSPGATPGKGLDVDGDPTTCAPAGDCSGGVDNAMMVIAEVMNPPLQEAFDAGTIMYVADLDGLNDEGEPFPVSVYDTEMATLSWIQECQFQSAADECQYFASQFSFDPTCNAYFGLPNAVVEGDELKAGGFGHTMTIALQLGVDVFIPLTLVHARMEGTLQVDGEGEVQSLDGLIAGATPKDLLMESIAALPEDYFPAQKDVVLSVLEQLVEADIDMDGDGELDASSVALAFTTVPADLVE